MLELKKGSVLALVMLAFAGQASAIGIGILKVDSHLGEAFRASVKIVASPDETVDASCISLDQSASDNGIFQLGSARLGVGAANGSRIVRIATDQKINEPIVTLRLRIHCGDQGAIEKSFTVFLDPPSTSPEVPEAAEPIGKPLSEKTPAEKAHAARAPAEESTGNLFRIKPNDTLSGIAHDFFPNSTMAQRRFMAAVLRENPELSPNHLEAGSQIRIPDIGPKGPLAKPAKPELKASASKKAVVPAAKAAAKPAFHLDIVSSAPKPEARPNNAAQDLKRTETQLIARADDQTVQMLQLQGQVKTLEAKLAELQSRIAVADRLLAKINAAKIQPPPPPAATFPKWAWMAAALLALLAVAAGIFWYLMKKRKAAEQSLLMDRYLDPKRSSPSLIDPLDYFESDSSGQQKW